jgi:hypothetical protein
VLIGLPGRGETLVGPLRRAVASGGDLERLARAAGDACGRAPSLWPGLLDARRPGLRRAAREAVCAGDSVAALARVAECGDAEWELAALRRLSELGVSRWALVLARERPGEVVSAMFGGPAAGGPGREAALARIGVALVDGERIAPASALAGWFSSRPEEAASWRRAWAGMRAACLDGARRAAVLARLRATCMAGDSSHAREAWRAIARCGEPGVSLFARRRLAEPEARGGGDR